MVIYPVDASTTVEEWKRNTDPELIDSLNLYKIDVSFDNDQKPIVKTSKNKIVLSVQALLDAKKTEAVEIEKLVQHEIEHCIFFNNSKQCDID